MSYKETVLKFILKRCLSFLYCFTCILQYKINLSLNINHKYDNLLFHKTICLKNPTSNNYSSKVYKSKPSQKLK